MPQTNTSILLTTLNARYIHSAFGLRYLLANLGKLQSQTTLKEFTIHERPIDIVEKILEYKPKIVGLSVYIWNVSEIGETVALLKQVAPEICIILGGPEVSHLPDKPEVVDLADYIIKGPGEISFRKLCEQILNEQKPLNKVIEGEAETLDKILSDDAIVERLQGEGIYIARRTVAKYREAMKIASSVQRRRDKALPV